MMKNNQSGFSLLVTVMLFVALTIVGLAVMRSGILSEKQSVNIQEKSVSFFGAQSANNSTIESYHYNTAILEAAVTAAAGEVDLSTHNKSSKTCVDSKGIITTSCSSLPALDDDAGILKASTDTFYRSCLTALKCSGNSAGLYSENSVGCNVFQHKGSGIVDIDKNGVKSSGESKTDIEQWSILVSACEKNI